MFTDCPGCARQFHIRATQLSAANGEVKCGYCGKQFNALAYLRDTPLPGQGSPVSATGKAKHTQAQSNKAAPNKTPVASKQTAAKADAMEKESVALAEGATRPDTSDSTFIEAVPSYALLEELLEPEAKRSGWFARLCWTLLTLLLLLVAITQLAWFNRDHLLSRHPELIPYARQLCERMQCELIRYRNISAITLLNRDVREHPRYEGALLINATLVNQAGVIQPFPRIQLGLFDTSGKLLAYREFSAHDYLDASINIDNGMAADQPIHIVLEVIGSTKDTVGFEFRFL